jgi:hypothetical protein
MASLTVAAGGTLGRVGEYIWLRGKGFGIAP